MVRELLERSRRRQKKLVIFALLRWISVPFLFVALALGVFYLPPLQIRSVSVEGMRPENQVTLQNEILSLLSGRRFFILPKANILLFPQTEVEDFLRSQPRIKEFALERRFSPAMLMLTIKEERVWAIGCAKKGEEAADCFFLNDSSVPFAPAPLSSGTAIVKIFDHRGSITPGCALFSPGALEKIRFFLERLPACCEEEVVAVEIVGDDALHLVLKNGWFVIADSRTDPARSLENLILTLDSQIKNGRKDLEYVDLRFADKVFYRFRQP